MVVSLGSSNDLHTDEHSDTDARSQASEDSEESSRERSDVNEFSGAVFDVEEFSGAVSDVDEDSDAESDEETRSSAGSDVESSGVAIYHDAKYLEDAEKFRKSFDPAVFAQEMCYPRLFIHDRRIEFMPYECLYVAQIAKEVLSTGSPLAAIHGGNEIKEFKCCALVEVSGATNIVGDIHGQYPDLVRYMTHGSNNKLHLAMANSNYVFLGDYVDRGKRSLEVVMLLFCLRIAYPEQIVMLRGNHELRSMNIGSDHHYGFWDELCERYDKKIAMQLFEAFNCAFEYLPYYALIGKKVLAMHGGISPCITSIQQLKDIKLPIKETIHPSIVNDALWADPMEDVDLEDEKQVELAEFLYHPCPRFKFNDQRQTSFKFNRAATDDFCERLDIDMIVRAHQCTETGFEFFHGKKGLSIFSAPAYCGERENTGCIVAFSANGEFSAIAFVPREEEVQVNDNCHTVRRQLSKKKISLLKKMAACSVGASNIGGAVAYQVGSAVAAVSGTAYLFNKGLSGNADDSDDWSGSGDVVRRAAVGPLDGLDCCPKLTLSKANPDITAVTSCGKNCFEGIDIQNIDCKTLNSTLAQLENSLTTVKNIKGSVLLKELRNCEDAIAFRNVGKIAGNVTIDGIDNQPTMFKSLTEIIPPEEVCNVTTVLNGIGYKADDIKQRVDAAVAKGEAECILRRTTTTLTTTIPSTTTKMITTAANNSTMASNKLVSDTEKSSSTWKYFGISGGSFMAVAVFGIFLVIVIFCFKKKKKSKKGKKGKIRRVDKGGATGMTSKSFVIDMSATESSSNTSNTSNNSKDTSKKSKETSKKSEETSKKSEENIPMKEKLLRQNAKKYENIDDLPSQEELMKMLEKDLKAKNILFMLYPFRFKKRIFLARQKFDNDCNKKVHYANQGKIVGFKPQLWQFQINKKEYKLNDGSAYTNVRYMSERNVLYEVIDDNFEQGDSTKRSVFEERQRYREANKQEKQKVAAPVNGQNAGQKNADSVPDLEGLKTARDDEYVEEVGQSSSSKNSKNLKKKKKHKKPREQ